MPKSKIRIMTSVAMMTAFSVVLERLLPLVNTDTMRVSLGNVPIIITSIFFGPVPGMLCGIIADIIGCFLNGYPPFPVLMLAPLTVGLLPGISAKLARAKSWRNISDIFVLSATVIITNLLASVIITTIGLGMLYGTPVTLLLVQRIPTFAVNTLIEIAVLYLLLKNGLLYKLFGIQK